MAKGLNWRLKASCLGMDTRMWYPSFGEYEKARKICNGCSVRIECLQDAMSHENDLYGMFGGLTPSERHELRNKTNGIKS